MSRAGQPVRRRWYLAALARRWWVAVLASVALWFGAGTAFAGWGTTQASEGATIHAGELGVNIGPLTWECPEQALSGDAASLPDLMLAPGQTLVLRQAVVPSAVGANMRVALSVGFASLPDGTTATWHLEVGGTQVAPPTGEATLADTLLVPVGASPVAVVTLSPPPPEPLWVDPTVVSGLGAAPYTLGVMTVTAHQVRCGDGFAVPCAVPGTGAGHA